MDAFYIDILAGFCGISAAILSSRNLVYHWPLTILSCTLSATVFALLGMYANTFVQIVAVVLGFKGIYEWRYGVAKRVSWASDKEMLYFVSILFLVAPLLSLLFAHFNQLYLLDVISSIFLLAAFYALGRRWVQVWFIFITVDLYYIYAMFNGGMFYSMAKFVLYNYFCIVGYYKWARVAASELSLEESKP